ncbi:hypothetical protein D3C83_164520 [compost metagenome]
MRTARIASRILRLNFSSELSRKMRATCWVMVEAPWGRRRWITSPTSLIAARRMPEGSTPGWL